MIFPEEFDSAIEELKRADHSIFATLKYTRSCDVVVNVLERISKTYANAITAVLISAQEKGMVNIVPPDAKTREAVFRQLYPSLKEYVDTYQLFRKILQIREYSCTDEFRKNLTLIAQVDGNEVRMNVEQIEHSYFETKKFMGVVKEILSGEYPTQ
jgi:preprotein translocase subunit Sec63